MVNGEVPLGHDLLQIAVRQGISQVPANAQEDDHIFEMPPTEQCWPSSSHDTPYQITSIRVCNTTSGGIDRPPFHIGHPLYPAGHSLIVFLVVFAITSIFARRIVYEMLGWLLHILIDIPTHSFSYYATPIPVAGFGLPR